VQARPAVQLHWQSTLGGPRALLAVFERFRPHARCQSQQRCLPSHPQQAGQTLALARGRRTSSAQMTLPGRPPPPSPPPARPGARTVRTAPCGRRGPRRARAGRRAAPPARRRAARPLPLRGSECAQPVGAEDRVRFLVPGGRVDGLEDVHTANAAFQEHIQ